MRPVIVPKRLPKRSRVLLQAELDDGAGPTPARIRDVSRSGALVEADQPPRPGSTVRLTCGDATVAAHVAWADDKWFGVEFFTPVVAGALKDATGAQMKVSAPRTYRSGDVLD